MKFNIGKSYVFIEDYRNDLLNVFLIPKGARFTVSDDNFFRKYNAGCGYYYIEQLMDAIDEEAVLIEEEIYNSPLYKALNEE